MSFNENKKIILVFGCLCIFFPGSFVFGFPGVMASEWQAMFNINKAQMTRMMFFVLAGTGCSMFLAGRLQEKLPTRLVILFGTLTCAAGMIAVAYARHIVHVYLWAFSEGFFCGFVYIPALAFFQRIFPEKKGWITGILNLTFGGSSAVMSPVYTWLLVTHGYQAAAWIAGVIALLASVWAAILIRDPESGRDEAQKAVVPMKMKDIFKTPAFWFLWWIWALAGASGVSFIVLASSFGEYKGYGITQSIYILTGFNILNGVGRLLLGRLADIFHKPRILQAVFLAAAAAYLLMPWISNLYGLSFLACFIGLSFGGMFTVSAPLVSDVFGLENFGRIFGLIFTAYGFVAGFIGPWMSGVLLDMTGGNYLLVFTLFAVFYSVSSFLVLKVKLAGSFETACNQGCAKI